LKPRDRRAKIAELIDQQGQAGVDDLAETFDVSAETIRRDLSDLAEEGRVQKIHGGAKKMRFDAEGSFQQRMSENASAKALIGQKLAGLVRPGQTLFLDTGSTTLAAVDGLAMIDDLTVVTNSMRIAREMGDRADIHLLGGSYRADNAQTVGPQTINHIGTFIADHAILTVGALDATFGAADYNIEEAQIARAMIAQARQITILADSSKFTRTAPFVVCGLDRLDTLITDGTPPPALAQALASAGVTVL
jgi:DeoR family glycerol-3-phosphate regulon repressor